MPLPRPSRHALPAVAAIAVSLVAPLLGARGDAVAVTAGSVTARAASAEDVVPAAAPETQFALDGPAMAAARTIAEQHWGRPACGGAVEVAWTRLEEGTNATATWRNPTDAWNNPDKNFACRIELNVAAEYDWPKLCTVMAHETGHLVGQPHADASGELMSPFYSEPLPACTGAEPGAPAASPEPAAESAIADAVPARLSADRPLRSSKRRTTCARRFRATRRAQRCARRARQAARAARNRR